MEENRIRSNFFRRDAKFCRKPFFSVATAIFFVLLFCSVFAIPMQLPVQGKLKGQNASDVNKILPMTFSIYSVASGGSAIWSQTKNVDVNIIDEDNNIGVFSTLIGDVVTLDFNSHIDMNFLGIKIQSNAELSPRIRIGATAYAYVAKDLAVVKDLNIGTYGYKAFGDSNFNSVYANRFFGSGLGLTGIPTQTDINAGWYGKLDINRWFQKTADQNNFFVQLQNAYLYDSNANTVCDGNTVLTGNGICQSITDFYLSGTGGLPADMNQAYYSQLDANRVFERLADLNLFFYRKTDINAGWYGVVDVNRNFLSIRDANLWYYTKTDVNAHFQGKADLNANFPGFIRLGNAVDMNLAAGGVTAWDGNFYTLRANYLFGDASGVTGVLTMADGNKHYVPYIGADYDVNLGVYGITADGFTVGDKTLAAEEFGFLDAQDQYVKIASSPTFAGLTVTDGGLTGTIDTEILGVSVGVSSFLYPTTSNLEIGSITAPWRALHSVDVNATSITATAFFGSGAGLTGVTATTNWADLNAHLVPYIAATKDVNLNNRSIKAFGLDNNFNVLGVQGRSFFNSDINVTGRITATNFVGDGSGLTNLPSGLTWNDINAHIYGKLDVNRQFVPYIGATKDVNLNGKNIGNINAVGATGYYANGYDNDEPVSLNAWDKVSAYYSANWDFIAGTSRFSFYPTHDTADLGMMDYNWSNLYIANSVYAKDINAIGVMAGNIFGTPNVKIIGDVNITKGVNRGVSIQSDANRICFPSNTCEMYLDFNGTAFVIFGS